MEIHKKYTRLSETVFRDWLTEESGTETEAFVRCTVKNAVNLFCARLRCIDCRLCGHIAYAERKS